jgi:hypothetical protein
MDYPVIVAKCPETYTKEQKEEIKKVIQTALETDRIIVIPESVDIMILP